MVLYVSTNLNGFSLANRGRFTKFAKLSPRQLFPVYGILSTQLTRHVEQTIAVQLHTNRVDEVMIPFKGRLGFKQYMKDKTTKWGTKAFTLSDATNGYVYRL